MKPRILTSNSGSSSIGFALYAVTETLERVLHGKVERIGLRFDAKGLGDRAATRGRVILAHRDSHGRSVI